MDGRENKSSARIRGGPLLRRIFVQLCLAWLCVSMASGCQIVIGILLTLRGRPMLDADFKKTTHRSLQDKDKRVVVLCSATATARSDAASIDQDIISLVSRKMKMNDINVVDSNKVAEWVDDKGGDIEDAEIREIGKEFNADYVVHVHIKDFQYRERSNTTLFRGRLKAQVTVLAIDKTKKGSLSEHLIYQHPFDTEYPLHQPIAVEQRNATIFLREFNDRASEEIAKLFYDHRPGEEF